MIPAITASKIYSTLGNNDSLVPLAIKDIANSMGLTAGSYITGDKAEGKDRFIDEFGTQAIWLFGIPVYKKVLDWTIFKPFNYDPKVDPRIMHDKEVLKQAIKYADESVKGSIQKAANNSKVFKGLSFGKFAASTALTILTYWGLTKFRYKYTDEQIAKEAMQQQMLNNSKLKQQISTPAPVAFSPAFNAVHNPKAQDRQPSFTGKGALEVLDHFMFSPANNLMLVDGAITAERLLMSETKQDFMGYVVKEGSFWAFMYIAGKRIQNYMEKVADTKHQRNIGLDARVIESQGLNRAMKNGRLTKSMEEFAKVYDKSDAEIYKFLNENPDNLIVKFAKKSDVIQTMDKKVLGVTVKKSSKIDNRKYIDISEVKRIYENLGKLSTQLDDFLKKGATNTVDTFLNEVKSLKRKSIRTNIGSCIAALGIVAPAIMVGMRFLSGNKEFERKERVLAQLQEQGALPAQQVNTTV